MVLIANKHSFCDQAAEYVRQLILLQQSIPTVVHRVLFTAFCLPLDAIPQYHSDVAFSAYTH
jgi:hypothetical protein